MRRYRTVHGDERSAARELEALAAQVVRRDLGDLRVRELLDRYVHANHQRHSPAEKRDRQIVDELNQTGVGNDLAAFVTSSDVMAVLNSAHRHGGAAQARNTLGLIRDTYRWAKRQGWIARNPTRGVTLRTVRTTPATRT
jgi:hypothetical protein